MTSMHWLKYIRNVSMQIPYNLDFDIFDVYTIKDFTIKWIPFILLKGNSVGSVSYITIKDTSLMNKTIQEISKKVWYKGVSFFNALSISCKTIILLLKVHLTYKALTTRSSLRNGRSVDLTLDKTPSTIDTSLLLNMIFRMYLIVAAKLNL